MAKVIDDRVRTFGDKCLICKHSEDYNQMECDAFKRIPLEIWNGNVSHRKPYKGDKGIQFNSILNKG